MFVIEFPPIFHFPLCIIEQKIDLESFFKLNTEDLKEMNIKIGPRKKILDIISELQKSCENIPSTTQPTDSSTIEPEASSNLNEINTIGNNVSSQSSYVNPIPWIIINPEVNKENEIIIEDQTETAPIEVATTSKNIQPSTELNMNIASTSKSNVNQETTRYSCVSFYNFIFLNLNIYNVYNLFVAQRSNKLASSKEFKALKCDSVQAIRRDLLYNHKCFQQNNC